MRIINLTPVSMASVKDICNLDEKKNLSDYLKRFLKLKKADSEKLQHEINALNNVKIKDEHIVKISDFLPRDKDELNKIFNDVSLDEKEINDILEIVKKY